MTTLPTSKTDPREDKLIELLGEGMTLKEAGRQAGYSEQYCRSSIIRKWD
jgi:DNA-binding CsgD family transcriptional regulator